MSDLRNNVTVDMNEHAAIETDQSWIPLSLCNRIQLEDYRYDNYYKEQLFMQSGYLFE